MRDPILGYLRTNWSKIVKITKLLGGEVEWLHQAGPSVSKPSAQQRGGVALQTS